MELPRAHVGLAPLEKEGPSGTPPTAPGAGRDGPRGDDLQYR